MRDAGLFAILVSSTVSFAGFPAPARSQSLEVEFLGNAAVRISDGRRTVVSDFPYESGYSGYMQYDFESTRPEGPVIVLITHRHRDHFDPDLFTGTGWTFIGPRANDPVPDRVLPEPEVMKLGDVTVEAYATPHAGIPHRSYVLRWHGHSFFLPGDTEDVRALDAAGDVDVLFITPWLLQKAERSGHRLTARRVIVYHHTAGQSVRCATCHVPEQGERITLEVTPSTGGAEGPTGDPSDR